MCLMYILCNAVALNLSFSVTWSLVLYTFIYFLLLADSLNGKLWSFQNFRAIELAGYLSWLMIQSVRSDYDHLKYWYTYKIHTSLHVSNHTTLQDFLIHIMGWLLWLTGSVAVVKLKNEAHCWLRWRKYVVNHCLEFVLTVHSCAH